MNAWGTYDAVVAQVFDAFPESEFLDDPNGQRHAIEDLLQRRRVAKETESFLVAGGYLAEEHALAPLLGEVEAFLARFVSYPSEATLVAHVLWIAHTHLIEAFESTPRLAFLSPEPASGKTRALELTELLVPNPVEAVNVTPSYLFRKVGDEEAGMPTILFDEIDTVFGPQG